MASYAYLAIEGNIGAGKTTLCKMLANHLGSELILERFEENPFLERFYEDPKGHAFSVELAFVADRYKQLREALGRRNLFRQKVIADYSFAKSLIFAKTNLPREEYALFSTMFRLMEAQVPKPEVIAILDPGLDRVKKQIVERGRAYEQNMPDGYLEKVKSGYEAHYQYHRGSRVLHIDISGLDFVKNKQDYRKLISCILAPRKPGVYHSKP